MRVQWMPIISEPGIIQSASLAQGLLNSFSGSSSCNFYFCLAAGQLQYDPPGAGQMVNGQ